MKRLLSWFLPSGPKTLAYMLQQFEYNPSKFLLWAIAYPDLGHARIRGRYVSTKRGHAMLIVSYGSYIAWLMVSAVVGSAYGWGYLALALLAQPAVVFVLFSVSILVQVIVVNPRQRKEIAVASKKLSGLSVTKIAVLGSYGKTSMKELLLTVLAEGRSVAATPGNKNVLVSHARWINNKVTNQEILVIEYGEAEPGDIAKLAGFSKPDIAVVTGLAPAHLDYYPTLEAIADDFGSITDFVPPDNVFCSATSELLTSKLPGAVNYDQNGVAGWKVTDIRVSLDGTSFTMSKGKDKMQLHSGLLGLHQVGPLAAVVTIAKQLGLTNTQIVAGIAKTRPYEHRMQPKQLYGAWIIDDAYNGNIEGMKAGLALLSALPAKRRIYVTPGLVDQGTETETVHRMLGKLIAGASLDRVVLMQNSVTKYIQSGMDSAGFTGEVQIETDPLAYYNSLDQHIAAGDVIMLQNDWPDSYK